MHILRSFWWNADVSMCPQGWLVVIRWIPGWSLRPCASLLCIKIYCLLLLNELSWIWIRTLKVEIEHTRISTMVYYPFLAKMFQIQFGFIVNISFDFKQCQYLHMDHEPSCLDILQYSAVTNSGSAWESNWPHGYWSQYSILENNREPRILPNFESLTLKNIIMRTRYSTLEKL